MTIDWWTLGLQTVNVVVLIWLLGRFLFRPVSKIIAERQAAAHAALDEAEAARTEAQAARDAANAETADLARKRGEMMAQAQTEAAQEKASLLDDARKAADKARAETRAELVRLHAAQAKDMADEAGALATDIATRLLDRLPDSAKIDGFVDGLVTAVTDLPQSTRSAIGADGPVHLRAARALSGDEKARLTARLGEVLDREVAVDIEADESLIAGLELDAPHAIVRNHFRADLDRIKAEVTGHD